MGCTVLLLVLLALLLFPLFKFLGRIFLALGGLLLVLSVFQVLSEHVSGYLVIGLILWALYALFSRSGSRH